MKKKNLYTAAGVPKRIRCYMVKRVENRTCDYITVVYTHAHIFTDHSGTVQYRSMCENPTAPQGFGIWGEAERWRFSPGGSRVDFHDLPKACQEVVLADYADIWGEQPPKMA